MLYVRHYYINCWFTSHLAIVFSFLLLCLILFCAAKMCDKFENGVFVEYVNGMDKYQIATLFSIVQCDYNKLIFSADFNR